MGVLTSTAGLLVDASGGGGLHISAAGTFDTSSTYLSFEYIGNSAGSSGDVTVDGANSLWESTGQIDVGASGNGTLRVSNHGTVVDTFGLIIGENQGATGTLDIAGGGTLTTGPVEQARALLVVGASGTGVATVTQSSDINAAVLTVGQASGGQGSISITAGGTLLSGVAGARDSVGLASRGIVAVDGSGSVWESKGQICIGVSADGTLAVSNGASVLAADEIDVAVNAGSTGSFEIESGATATSGGSYDTIDGGAGSVGKATVTGANSTWNLNAQLIVGNDGTGALDINSGGSVSAGQVTVGQFSGSQGSLSISGGGTLLSAGPYDQVARGQGSTGTVTVDGTGSLWRSGGGLTIGNQGSGTVTIESGGQLSVADGLTIGGYNGPNGGTAASTGVGSLLIETDGSVTADGNIGSAFDNIGGGAGSDGTLTVTDAGSLLSVDGVLTAGDRGNGLISVLNGGSVYTSGLWDNNGTTSTVTNVIGGEAGSTGTLAVGAGAFTTGGAIAVGVSGAGTLMVSNSGSVNAAGEIDVAESVGSIGQLTIESGGSVTSEGGFDSIGGAAGADGTFIVTGPGSSWLMTADLAIGNDGTGELDISNQGRVQNAGTLYNEVGAETGSNGTVSIDGIQATWDDLAPLSIGDGGTGVVSVDGGTLIASGAGAVAPTGLEVGGYHGGTGALTISDGGTVQSNGSLDFVGNGVGSNGSVTVEGNGSTWLSTGAVGIGNDGDGTLIVTGDGGAAVADRLDIGENQSETGTMTISSGGRVASGGTFNIIGGNGSKSGDGMVVVDGAGSEWTTTAFLGIGRIGSA